MASTRLFTDGGARGNPGPAAIGGVAYRGDDMLFEFHERIGETTNNQAEYQALLRGLAELQKRGVRVADCFLDSELVVRQLRGEYRVKQPDLRPLFAEIMAQASRFERLAFHHVPREQNTRADRLVNQALDEVGNSE